MVEESYTVEVRNPQASQPLKFKVTSNVSLDEINANVARNSKLDHPWVSLQEENEREICIVGGGPSMPNHFDEIKRLRDEGAFVMAINGASIWLSKGGLFPDTQFIIDAKQETSELVDFEAKSHCFASQVHPHTMESVSDVIMVQLASPGVEDHLPPEKVEAGGYTLIGGGACAGNSAVALAYVLGYRSIHVFGLDSSYADGQSHCYAQPMNDEQHRLSVRFGNQMYLTTFPMRLQADYFLSLSAQLEKWGCKIHVYGEGLLPDMYYQRKTICDEKSKYEYIWSNDKYGVYSPALEIVNDIADFAPKGPILDIGCGNGLASYELSKRGYQPLLTDLVSNSRALEAAHLPFMEWDWSQEPLQETFGWGFCCDMMEHIPEDQVRDVLKNIRNSCEAVFFRIEFEPDAFGPMLLGSPLHLTVRDEEWWRVMLHGYWPSVECKGNGQFVCTTDW